MSKRQPNTHGISPSKPLNDAAKDATLSSISAEKQENAPENDIAASSGSLPEYRAGQAGVILLCGLLRKALSAEIGILIQNVSVNHEYNEDDQSHCFKLMIDRHLKGQRSMSAETRKAIRLETREGIHTFLQNFDIFVDEKEGDVFSRYGEIYFSRKIDIFNQLKAYFEEVCHQNVDIKSFTFADKDEEGEKLRHKIAKSQSHLEEMSRIVEKIESIIQQQPNLAHTLFGFMPTQSFSGLTEAYAFATAISQEERETDHFPLILALAEQLIRHEGGLETREDNFQLSHQPIKFSIN